MPKELIISTQPLTTGDIRSFLENSPPVRLNQKVKTAVNKCHKYLSDKLADSDQLFYGINTGFGSLCNIQISKKETTELQSNLIKSHACGTGDEVPEAVVRLILLLKIKNLSLGYSGVRLALVERLVDFYNAGVLPQIFQLGSLGASGDLAPLAHLALPLIGEGKVRINGKLYAAKVLEKKFGWKPLSLQAKEGLAMLNGTQFSTAYGLWACLRFQKLMWQANMIAALSIDVFNCQTTPFDQQLHVIRPHPGQRSTAQAIRKWRKGSPLSKQKKKSVQDPYSFRCVPQVHGASTDALTHVENVISIEMNSVTDNPTIFPDSDNILSGGNFHAQPVALSLDYLATACAEIGSISERRTYQLISGQRGLPPFLIEKPGLHSGLMIPQYTAAAIVSQNKQLASPASIDSIVSCNGQEDHVSMAANGATRLYRMIDNLERILAIEWMSAVQALYIRRPLKTSSSLEKIVAAYRKKVAPLTEDRILSEDIEATVQFLKNQKI